MVQISRRALSSHNSIVTMFSEHWFEEMIEDGGHRGLSEDPVSDMYIFNPAGILLFLSDDVCR